ncbi:MAG: hypothetical protein IT317_06275 [Anaerolineales bacterium]|nr:hypothetical protein [Anaerolineales bacterium]
MRSVFSDPTVLSRMQPRAPARGWSLPRLALLNGFLIGLALALGAYLPDVAALAQAPVRLAASVALMGSLGVVALASAAGWLGGRFEALLPGVLAWAVAAALIVVLMGHLPYEGRSLAAWLADPRFWGRAVYVFDTPAQVRQYLAGFFVLLGLVILSVVQGYRLEGVRAALSRGRLTARASLLLFLPLPLAAGLGYIADNNINRPLRVAPLLVHDAFETARAYSGDLFALSRETGVNYGAVAGVRDLMGEAGYTLMLGELDLGVAETVIVVAHFDNGAWINCRVLASQLSHCYEASGPYVQGLAGALSGQGTPDCLACTPTPDAATRAWLLDHGRNFNGPPRVTRLAQWGSHVLMRAADLASGYAIECFYAGMTPVRISACREAPAE